MHSYSYSAFASTNCALMSKTITYTHHCLVRVAVFRVNAFVLLNVGESLVHQTSLATLVTWQQYIAHVSTKTKLFIDFTKTRLSFVLFKRGFIVKYSFYPVCLSSRRGSVLTGTRVCRSS